MVDRWIENKYMPRLKLFGWSLAAIKRTRRHAEQKNGKQAIL